MHRSATDFSDPDWKKNKRRINIVPLKEPCRDLASPPSHPLGKKTTNTSTAPHAKVKAKLKRVNIERIYKARRTEETETFLPLSGEWSNFAIPEGCCSRMARQPSDQKLLERAPRVEPFDL